VNYAREHIKRYWVFAYRRALGISMFTFAIALAIGMIFTSMLASLFIISPLVEMLFWFVLILITALTLTVSFVEAHISSVKYMNMVEHQKHSKYVGIWMTSLVIGALAFILPAIFIQNYYLEPIILLFSFGGIMWVLYASVRMLFKHSYFEIAYGASVLWVIFIIGLAVVVGNGINPITSSEYIVILFVSMASLIVVFGSVGMSMMFRSTKDFVADFEKIVSTIEGKSMHAQKSPRKSSAAKRK